MNGWSLEYVEGLHQVVYDVLVNMLNEEAEERNK